MRRFYLMLIAILLAGGAFVHKDAKPAHAVGAACWWADSVGVVYNDWYGLANYYVDDSWPGGNPHHWIDTDIQTFRLSGGNGIGQDGYCYRGYYVSDWSEDGSGGNWRAVVQKWVCGTYIGSDDSGTTWGSRNEVVSSGGQLQISVTLPSGNIKTVGFYNYGTTPCLPQATNGSSSAQSNTWNFDPTAGPAFTLSQPYTWYCHTQNGIVCGSGP